ncbi:MAG: hypothetical protein PHU49_00470 [Syntrophorhabdaceae bacterium]|nr:hypothetical protein [Syntrophorhabdaceae bacterium]
MKKQEIVEMTRIGSRWLPEVPETGKLPKIITGGNAMTTVVKFINVRVPGTDRDIASHDLAVRPGTRACDVLREIGLQGYQLSRGGEKAFRPETELFGVVADGEILFASPADMSAGKIYREVPRGIAPLMESRGWRKTSDGWEGFFQTKQRSYPGYIRVGADGSRQYFVMNPPDNIPHYACLHPCGNNWFIIHWNRAPQDLNSFILFIEDWLSA